MNSLDMSDFYTQHPIVTTYLVGNFVSFLVFCLYLEINPKLTGILFRPDHTGKWKFQLSNITGYLTAPFTTKLVWNPHFWDINWVVATQFGAGLFTTLCYLNDIREWLQLA